MKIYTKKGDDGTTGLIGGTRVPKYHLRIESYGTIDELNSYLGLVRDVSPVEDLKAELKFIQDRLFMIGSSLAADPEKNNMILPDIEEADIEKLEQSMDRMNEALPELKNFILPGGHQAVSHAHVARCICRRAERLIVHLNANAEVDPMVIQYLNRLSDYLFMLARFFALKLEVEETTWSSRT